MFNTKIIGKKIAEARKKINISQAQIADRLFISPQAVGKWERGESMPDITTFSRLAEILGVDLNYFSENFQSGDDETALKTAVDSTENTEKSEQDDTKQSGDREQILTNFSASNLTESDFAGVTLHKGKFESSALQGSDFTGADLTGSKFTSSDLRDANFDGANLTDCKFTTLVLKGASFHQPILVRTEFSKLELSGTKFTDIKLTDVNLFACDLRKTIFKGCSFNGVDFKHSDLRGLCLDGQTFTGVKFDGAGLNEVSFRGATLKNVSFRSLLAVTNKYYLAIKTICFDGASMDKLTYATLKGMNADLSRVTVI